MQNVVKVYPVNDDPYTHAAILLVDGKRLPLGVGTGRGLNAEVAARIAASNAGLRVGVYDVEHTTLEELINEGGA